MPDVFIVATALDGTLNRAGLELIGGAHRLGLGAPSAVLVGHGAGMADAPATLHEYGVPSVLRVDHPTLTVGQTDAVLTAVETVARRSGAAIVLVTADTVGRELAPRLAYRMNAALATECIDLASDGGTPIARRQVYGGRAVATMAITRRPAVLSVKARALEVPEPAPVAGSVDDVPVPLDANAMAMRVTGVQREQAALGLEDAQIVIGGGRGLGGPDGFRALQDLAAALGGAVGSSRPPADAGWVPINWQIGQTGKTIRPALYIAVAISGATQHVAGVSGARTIVAINRDPDAPIFSLAHLGLVGDYREIVPLLTAKIKELKGG